MPSTPYATQPLPGTSMPPGIPFIIGNEVAERFSYYGMRAILIVFMTQYLRDASGAAAPLSDEAAKAHFHWFQAAAYFFPMLGGLLSDVFLGKYRTILSLSLVYCLGHLALALDDTLWGLRVGLTLIAIGSGGIKPCVSAHVGDQFGSGNRHLIEKAYYWFYFSINLGSFVSTLLIPTMLEHYGPHVAFGLPGLLMFAATVVFWMGRYRFVHIPPGGMEFVRDLVSVQGLNSIKRLGALFLFVAPFWCLSDQGYSAWVLQAKRMDLHFMGIEWLPSQINAINPLLVLVFIPLFTYVVYPQVNRYITLTPLRKIGVGLALPAIAFLISAWIERQIDDGERPNIAWQLFGYGLMTAGEVLAYATCLEFAYTQAPKRMKSVIMSLMLASISLGNGATALVNTLIQNLDGSVKLSGASYYLAFVAFMVVVLLFYIPFALRFKTVKEEVHP